MWRGPFIFRGVMNYKCTRSLRTYICYFSPNRILLHGLYKSYSGISSFITISQRDQFLPNYHKLRTPLLYACVLLRIDIWREIVYSIVDICTFCSDNKLEILLRLGFILNHVSKSYLAITNSSADENWKNLLTVSLMDFVVPGDTGPAPSLVPLPSQEGRLVLKQAAPWNSRQITY